MAFTGPSAPPEPHLGPLLSTAETVHPHRSPSPEESGIRRRMRRLRQQISLKHGPGSVVDSNPQTPIAAVHRNNSGLSTDPDAASGEWCWHLTLETLQMKI